MRIAQLPPEPMREQGSSRRSERLYLGTARGSNGEGKIGAFPRFLFLTCSMHACCLNHAWNACMFAGFTILRFGVYIGIWGLGFSGACLLEGTLAACSCMIACWLAWSCTLLEPCMLAATTCITHAHLHDIARSTHVMLVYLQACKLASCMLAWHASEVACHGCNACMPCKHDTCIHALHA